MSHAVSMFAWCEVITLGWKSCFLPGSHMSHLMACSPAGAWRSPAGLAPRPGDSRVTGPLAFQGQLQHALMAAGCWHPESHPLPLASQRLFVIRPVPTQGSCFSVPLESALCESTGHTYCPWLWHLSILLCPCLHRGFSQSRCPGATEQHLGTAGMGQRQG